MQDEAGRQLMASLVPLTIEHGTALVGYIGLFRSHNRDLANDRALRLMREVLALGYQKIAFVAAQLDPRTMQRAEGYRRCLRDAGLYDPKLELLSPQPSSMRLGGELLEELLRTRPGVDAVFFCNDDLAQGGLLAAQRLGLSVPGQVAIAGFNDLAGSDQMLPPLTTVRTPRAAVGEASARMLLALMRGEVPAHNSVDLGFELTVREST